MKELLAENGFEVTQTVYHKVRRKKLKLGYGISQPQQPPVTAHKLNLKSQIDSGQIALGNQVVETEHISFSSILNKKQHYSGRQVPLKTLREVLLRDHCKVGLVRIEDNSATTAQATASDNRQCTRHLKI